MKKLEFKSFQFKEMITNGDRTFVCIKEAQEKFDAWLADLMKDAVVVYSTENNKESAWFRYTDDVPENIDKYKALLIDIREIEKVCKHEPESIVVMTNGTSFTPPAHGAYNISSSADFKKLLNAKCKHCRVELVAEWKAVE